MITRTAISLGILATGILLSSNYLQTSRWNSGSTNYRDKTFESLSCSGSTKLHTVVVKQSAKCSGSLTSTKSTFGKISASGSSTLNETTVTGYASFSGAAKLTDSALHGTTSFSGSLTGTNSTFTTITLSRTSKLTLTNSTVGSIQVDDSSSSSPTKDIDLYGGTVTGDIIFNYKDGKVILHNDATIKGKVIGGSIVKK